MAMSGAMNRNGECFVSSAERPSQSSAACAEQVAQLRARLETFLRGYGHRQAFAAFEQTPDLIAFRDFFRSSCGTVYPVEGGPRSDSSAEEAVAA